MLWDTPSEKCITRLSLNETPSELEPHCETPSESYIAKFSLYVNCIGRLGPTDTNYSIAVPACADCFSAVGPPAVSCELVMSGSNVGAIGFPPDCVTRNKRQQATPDGAWIAGAGLV